MLINPFTSVNTAAGTNSAASANRNLKAVDQLSSGDRIRRAADDVSGLAIAANLQNQVTELRSALTNTSQLASLTQTAEAGARQIQELTTRLEQLATQANNGALNDANRQALDAEFQEVVSEIDRIATGTQFNGTPLLDGSLSGDNALDISAALGDAEATEDSTLEIESLRPVRLFPAGINLTTQGDAEAALAAVQQAQNTIGTTIASIGSFEGRLDFASAFVETAIANQEAARATLSDADFAEAATDLSQANLQREAQVAVQAQSNRLPASLLDLVQTS